MTYTETGIIDTIERLAGTTLSALPQAQLDGIDQFHAGGPEAVERLIPGLRLTGKMSVLDVGSGLGGPARQLARAVGCQVVGVDITASYVNAALDLTRTAGLTDSVRFVHTDLADFEQTDFDAAYTIHVQMNVADKRSFFTQIARHLRPGARLAIFEVCRSGDSEPALPLPWSLDGSDNFLATADELRDTIQSSGFTPVEWVDESAWIRAWFDDLGGRLAAGPAPAALPALLADGPTRMLNYAIAVSTGAVTVRRGAFVLTP
jgi:SAM-dependent methyltransferase